MTILPPALMSKNKDGHWKVIKQYKNLGGVRRYVSNSYTRSFTEPDGQYHYPSRVALYRARHDSDSNRLKIYFEDGLMLVSDFADYSVMLSVVKRWRNLKGLPLWERHPSGSGWVISEV